jgi:hypothetical protein
LERCQFKHNTGNIGGTICSDSSHLTLYCGNITNPTLFENNIATYGGGAIRERGINHTIIATDGYFVYRNNSVGEVRYVIEFVSFLI